MFAVIYMILNLSPCQLQPGIIGEFIRLQLYNYQISKFKY